MANKTDHIELDDINWDDWGDIDQTGEGNWKDLDKKQKARKAVTHLKGGFISGVKDRILTKQGQRKYIEKGLPKEYGVAYDAAFETYDAVADLYDEATKEIKSIGKRTGSALKPLVDKYNAKLPRKMRDPLRKWTQNASKSNTNWDEGDRDEIQAIAQVNEIFARQESNRLHEKEVVEQKAQTGMLKNQNTILIELLKTAKASREHELQIDSVYKRKALELQYRQFAVQRKILDVQQQTMKLQQASFEKLIHNTGLPDVVKVHTSEVAKQMMTQKIFGDAINKWGTVPSRIISNLVKNSGKKIISSIKGGGDQGTDILSQVVQMLTAESFSDDKVGDGIVSGTKTGMNALEFLLSQNREIQLPGFLGGKSIKFNGPLAKAFEKAKKNRKIVRGAQKLQYLQRGFGRKMNEVAKGGSTGYGWLDTFFELGELRKVIGKDTTTVRKSSKNLDEAALFDIGTKKAITEIIPGYLSRIHWELMAARTGSTKHSLMTFDHGKNKFTTVKKLAEQTKKDIYDKNRSNVQLVMSETFKKLGFDKLSKDAQQAIERTMVLRALEGQNFDLSVLMNSRATKNQRYGLDDKVLEEIQKHLSKKGFKKTSQNVHLSANGQTSKAFRSMNQIAEAMDALQSGINNPLEVLRQNVSRGQGQVNRALGITDWDSSGDENVNKLRFVAGLLGHDFTDDERAANRDHGPANKKKKKVSEMTAFERMQHMAEQNNQGGSDGTGFSKGGYTGNESKTTPVGLVHGQEYVFDAQAVKKIGVETLDKLRAGKINLKEKSTQFQGVFKKGKGKFRDFLANQKISLNPGDDIVKAKEILIDDIYTRFTNLTGKAPENMAELKKKAKRDVHLRKLLGRLETLDRLGKAKMSDVEKSRIIRKLATEWDSIPLSTLGSRSRQTVKDFVDDLKDGTTKQRVKQGAQSFGDWANDKAKHSATAVNQMWNDLSSYSFGSGKKKENDPAKEALVTLAKGAFGVGKELAKARFYGFKVIPWGLKKIVGSLVHRSSFNFLKYGLWLQDGKELKLYASGLQEGRYLNGDMEIIEKPADVHGNIYDAEKLDEDGQPTLVMTEKEYRKGLFDHEGKQIVKPTGLMGKFTKAMSYVGWKGVKKLGSMTFKAARLYVAAASWPGRKIIDLIVREKKGKVQDPEALAQITMQDYIREEQRMTNTKLDEVIENLELMSGKNKSFNDSDGDGDRDGNALDKLEAQRNKSKDSTDKAKENSPKKEAKEKKPSILSSVMDMLKTGLGAVVGGLGKFVGMLAKGGIMALLGAFGIKSLLGWLKGDGDKQKIDPNDPRLDPTSPEYDPEFGQPSMLQKGAGWALDKFNNMSLLGQAAAGYGAYKLGGAAIKGAGKLAWKGGKFVADKVGGVIKDQLVKRGLAKAGQTVAQQGIQQVAKRGMLQAGMNFIKNQGIRQVGGFIARQAGMQALRTGVMAVGSAVAGTVGLPVVLGVAAVAALGYGAYKLYKSMKKDEVMITRARMAAYGYEVDNEKKVTKILELEGYLLENVNVTEKGEVSFKEGTSEDKVQEYFSVNKEDENSLGNWRQYFFGRFMPVFAHFVSAYKKHTGRTDLTKAEETMTYEQMQAMLPDTIIKGNSEHNPYLIMESGFAGDDKVELDKEEVFDIYATISTKLRNLVKKGATNKRQKERSKENKAVLKENAKVEKETANGGTSATVDNTKKNVLDKAKDMTVKAASFSPIGLVAKGVSAVAGAVDRVTGGVASSWLGGLWNKAKETASGVANSVGNMFSGGSSGGNVAPVSFNGQLIGNPGGGGYRDMPNSRGDGWSNNRDVILKAAQIVGVDPGLMAGMAAQESGFRPTVKAAGSSATGLFQFISGTWNQQLRQYGSKYGIPSGARATDAKANALLGAQFIRDNIVGMAKLGATQPGDAYLAHFLGLGGAQQALRAGDGASISRGFTAAAIRANPGIFNGTRTVGDVRRVLTQKMVEKHRAMGVDIPIGGMAGVSKGGTSSVPAGTNTVLKTKTTPTNEITTNVLNKTGLVSAPAGTNSVLKSTTAANGSKLSNTIPASVAGLSRRERARLKATGSSESRVNDVPSNNGGERVASTYGGGNPGTIIQRATGMQPFDIPKFISNLVKRAGNKSIGRCLSYVRTAAGWPGGVASAYMYHTQGHLLRRGFNEIALSSGYAPGDIIVIENNAAHKHGHICGFTGTMWVSDFKQPRGPQVYRSSPPPMHLYRHASSSGKVTAQGDNETVGGGSTESVADSVTQAANSGKIYKFKVNYMNFNDGGKPMKKDHDLVVRENGMEHASAVQANNAQAGEAAKTNAAPAGIVRTATGTSTFDVTKFVQHLEAKGMAKPSGYCARFVMNALNAAGISNSCRQPSAYMYPDSLLRHGFHEISMSTTPQAGDIVVNGKGYNGKSKHGHIQGFTGHRWISDFKQNKLTTALGRMFRHASLANGTPVANKDLTKPASGVDDSKVDKTNEKSVTDGITGASLNGGSKRPITGIGTYATGYRSDGKSSSNKTDAGADANASYRQSLGLPANDSGDSPLGSMNTMNGQPVQDNSKTNPNAATLKYELTTNNGKRCLSFTLKDGTKFIVELDAIGPAGRKTTIDGKDVVIKNDGSVVDYVPGKFTPTTLTPEQQAQAVNGKLNPDGSITYPGPDGKSITVNPKDVGPTGYKTHTGFVLFEKEQIASSTSSGTDIKKALDKPGTYVDVHGIVRNADGTPALIAGKPVSVTTKDGNLTTTITRTPYYQQKIPPELQVPTKPSVASPVANKTATTTSTKAVSSPQQTVKPTLAQAQQSTNQQQLQLQQQLAQQKANDVKTQQMQQSQVARQTQEALSTTAALNEQLKVQKDMLQTLRNIEKYFGNSSTPSSSWVQNDTSQTAKENATINNQKEQTPGLQIKGIPKVEPMSMSK